MNSPPRYRREQLSAAEAFSQAPTDSMLAFQQAPAVEPVVWDDSTRPTWATSVLADTPSAAPAAAAAAAPALPQQRHYAPAAPAVPSGLAGRFGGGYNDPAEYDAAVASGKFTPVQLQAAEAARQKYANTPIGLDAQQIRLASEGERATLAAGAGEQRALALAQERSDAASAKASETDAAQATQFESMRADFDASQARRLGDMDDLRADIQKTKIDPAQYWSKGSGFGQVLSLLSVAIGGFQHGYSGGKIENTGLRMLDQAIDRDIAAQRSNLENKRATLADSQSVFAMARQKFGDDRAAEEFTRARQNEALKNAASRYQGEARTEGMRQNAAKLETHFGLQAKLAENRVMQLYAAAEAQRLRAAAGAGASAASAASADERAREREEEKALTRRGKIANIEKTEGETAKLRSDVEGGGGTARETMGRYVPALGAVTGTPAQASDLNEQLALISKTTKLLESMKTLRLEGSTGGFGDDAARYDALRTDAIASINRAAKLGALDRGTLDLLDRSIPESALFSSDSKAAAKLTAAQQTLATGRAAAIANTPLVDVKLEQTDKGPRFTYGATSGARITPSAGWSSK